MSDTPISYDPRVMPIPPAAIRVPFRPRLTQFLVGANVLVFVAMVLAGRTSTFGTQQLLRWGADYGPYTFDGQGWRIWTSTYVHGFLLHIAGNMWCLWNLGMLAERILGRWTFAATYTACGIAGSLASLGRDPMRLSVGASGAILGLAGVLIAALYLGRLPFPEQALSAIKGSLLRFTGLTLLLGFIPIVDNSAHVGGLVMGLVIGALLAPNLSRPPEDRTNNDYVIFLAVALVLLGAWTGVKHVRGYAVPLGRAIDALRNRQPARAIPDLEAAARLSPRNLLVQGLLGETCIQVKDYPRAEAALKHLLDLKPGDPAAQFNLGLVYGATGRYEDARQAFSAYTKRDPNNDDAWMMLGSALKALHRSSEAEQALQQAVQLNSQNYEAYRELGWVQLEQNRPDDAMLSFQRALQVNPKDSDSVLGLGRSYLAKHMSKEAANALQQYQHLRSSNPEDAEPAGQTAIP